MKLSSALVTLGVLAVLFSALPAAHAYPLDEYDRTGIRRLKYQQDVVAGLHKGTRLVPGAKWPAKYIKLRMRERGRDYELTPQTPKDPALQAALEKVLKQWSWRAYNVAILDITDPAQPRFAAVNEHNPQTPGSVAKVLVASALFEQLRARYPNDIAAREKLLKTHVITADDWALNDSHEVPVVTGPKLDNYANRKIRVGDSFSLWEWIDHALSPSNNSAASTTWREATLMKLLGDKYPPSKYGSELWTSFSKDALTEASFAVVDKPLVDAGISPEEFKLRLYFTTGAGKYIRSRTCSGTAFSMIQWMLRVEQGRMVDEWSSLELKKMLYLTRRRVRYLYTHSLDSFGAFFKSGSLYRFTPEAPRIQYEGDIINVLNSLIEVDTTPPPPEALQQAAAPTGASAAAASPASAPAPKAGAADAAPAVSTAAAKPPYVYMVAVMSNELKRNAAMDHARLAEAIHAIITATPGTAVAIPTSPDAVKVPDIHKGSDEPDEGEGAETPE